ncbi:MAG: hypothetical protein IJS96_07570 [Schwartzia sp.]|nr:hypothetical protein [Schwartzia sp. (in: firmicutes)]
MRKRDKLPGDIWDGGKITLSRYPKIITEEKLGYCEDYKVGYNLFDVDGIHRRISLCELLRCEKESDRSVIASRLKECDTTYLAVDYVPRNRNQILWRFYFRILLQCCSFINGIKEGMSMVLVVNGAAKNLLMSMQQYSPLK